MGYMVFDKYEIPEIVIKNGKKYIYDKVRKKDVLFTPEEKVRQQVLTYLIDELKVPEYMIDEETAMSYYKVVSSKRPDILILKKSEETGEAVPMAVIECKRNNTLIDGVIIEQTLHYAEQLGCNYAMITDGDYVDVAYCELDNKMLVSIKSLPTYEDMLNGNYEGIL
ncbi:MAG: type I restriction enzyme HsdR N-terminal domain-containing protein [Clostridia bacterium]|nr:type I restriction enzyme HsdR N-terminal domain-containing protein [Clostridia bacterium]